MFVINKKRQAFSALTVFEISYIYTEGVSPQEKGGSQTMRMCFQVNEPNVPFYEKGGTAAYETEVYVKKNRNEAKSVPTWWEQ